MTKTPAKKIKGPPCKRGHDSLRYASTGGCVQCGREAGRALWTKHKDEIVAHRKQRYASIPAVRERIRERQLLRTYGVDNTTFAAMVAAQDGKCAICKKMPAAKKSVHHIEHSRLVVDHCHTTNAVRKLLCYKCNIGLGSFDDVPERLEIAAEYLRSTRR